jgi:hypothetical protein
MRGNKIHPQSLSCSNCVSLSSKILLNVFTYSNDYRNCVTLIQQPYTHHKLASSMNKNIPPTNCENNSLLHQHPLCAIPK